MEQKTYTDKLKGLITPKRIKIAVAVLVVCAIAAGGGAWYLHQQKLARKAEIAAAQTRVIQYQAAQQQTQLIDEAKARSIAADVIGKDEATLTFKKVELENKWDDDDYRASRRHEKGPRDGRPDGPQGNGPMNGAPQPQGQPQGQHPQPAQQPAPTQPAPQGQPQQPQGNYFFPVYDVEVKDGSVEYDIEINAVTGQVLHSDVDHH